MTKLPKEIRPYIIPLPSHDPVCDIKVKCPVCDEWMEPFTIDPRHKGKPVLRHPYHFRTCPTCNSSFSFSSEAQKIIWKTVHK